MAASNVPKGRVESALKAKSSKTTLFIEDCFFDETKTWLQTNPEERKSLNLEKLTKQKITRNNWVLSNGGKIITSDNKCVVPKREINGVLCTKIPTILPPRLSHYVPGLAWVVHKLQLVHFQWPMNLLFCLMKQPTKTKKLNERRVTRNT